MSPSYSPFVQRQSKTAQDFIQLLLNSEEPGFIAYPPYSRRAQLFAVHNYQKRAIAWETELSLMAYQLASQLNEWRQHFDDLPDKERLMLRLWNHGVQRYGWNEGVLNIWQERVNPNLFGMPDDADTLDYSLDQAIRFFNEWVTACRFELRQQQYKEQKQQKDQARRNLKSSLNYVQALRDRYARLLSVRVDLFYKPEYRSGLSLEALQQAREGYFKHLKEQPGLQSLLGYIWVIEEGSTKGLHLHLLAFFDGSQSREDVSLGKLLGELWMHYTSGKGSYFNINAEDSKQRLRNWQQTESYQAFMEGCFPGQGQPLKVQVLQAQAKGQNSLAVGMVEHHNEAAWINIHLQLHYFTKLEQRIPCIQRQGIRCFGKGQLPSAPSKPGRPRSQSTASNPFPLTWDQQGITTSVDRL